MSLIAHFLRHLDGRPVVESRESEKYRYVGGSRIMPIHCTRSQKSIISGFSLVVPNDSDEKTITRHSMIPAKVRATLSFRLNARLYRSNEKAVTAIPAVRIWLMVSRIVMMPFIQLVNE